MRMAPCPLAAVPGCAEKEKYIQKVMRFLMAFPDKFAAVSGGVTAWQQICKTTPLSGKNVRNISFLQLYFSFSAQPGIAVRGQGAIRIGGNICHCFFAVFFHLGFLMMQEICLLGSGYLREHWVRL